MSAQEKEVGIALFISEHQGFQGILKHRFSDFKVAEVDLEGKVASISNLGPPVHTQAQTNQSTPSQESIQNAISEFEKVVGEDYGQKFREFLKEPEQKNALMLENVGDKQTRTLIHNFFRNNKDIPQMVTETIKDESQGTVNIKIQLRSAVEEQVKQFSNRKGKKRGRQEAYMDAGFDPRNADEWEGGRGRDYVKFTIAKQNVDSQQAVSQICMYLSRDRQAVCFAGNKDKRAITFQKATAYRVPCQQLSDLNRKLNKVKVGDFEYVATPLQLGSLTGNQFQIILREVQGDPVQACQNVKQKGFINYFGLQRFGSAENSTHKVGLELLKGNWSAAVKMILAKNQSDKQTVNFAKDLFLKGDIKGAFRKMPKSLVGEWNILNGLLRAGETNYLEAINRIPRNLRTLYIHSYQAYLWNVAATHRISYYGSDKVVEGDLVACKQDNLEEGKLKHPRSDKIFNVKVLTKEDIKNGEYSIQDVVLPLPGSRIIYPKHKTAASFYDTAMKDGLPLDEELHRQRDFSMSYLVGDYRKVLVLPQNFEYETMEYEDINEDLATNEVEQINLELQVERPPNRQNQMINSLNQSKEKQKVIKAKVKMMQQKMVVKKKLITTMLMV
eukprot:TRINITY_DN1827_c0_g1_i2.p1 TRINITY_DN1827_c0_g1~~TRINITY_DN1827_c0_g1_i2.p1  ORF type:complete len:636 (-),score=73.90 TRINITY_DN1827_c0_g1_i2:738-2579(-)